jgi:hypothetical protein
MHAGLDHMSSLLDVRCTLSDIASSGSPAKHPIRHIIATDSTGVPRECHLPTRVGGLSVSARTLKTRGLRSGMNPWHEDKT